MRQTITVIAAGLLVVGTLTSSTVAPPSDEATKPAANPPQSTNTQTQVAVHKTAADCWIIISNKIYNVSPFLSQHPGGVGAITPYCGQEATIAFQTHGQAGGSNHSSYAYSLLTSYYVGDLNTTPTTYALSVSKSGTGTGTVSGSGIFCGSTCSMSANSGTSVTLTAASASGSVFPGWTGACSGTGR